MIQPMKALVQLPTDDPRIRAYRLASSTQVAAPTIHDIVRRQAAELDRGSAEHRRGPALLPWIATR